MKKPSPARESFLDRGRGSAILADMALNPEIRLPRLPVAVAGMRQITWLGPDGEVDGARRRLEDGARPIVCHAAAMARRLDMPPFPALDLLELYAFARPAQFALPTPRGLAESLGLALPSSPEAEAMSLLGAARALLADLAGGDATWAIRGLCWLDSLRAVAGTRGIRRGADRIEALESATPPNPHALAHSLVARSFTRAGGDAEADRARAAALFADAGYTQEPALLRGLEPAVSAAASPAHHPADLCDRWILGLELRTRRETLDLAARALDGQGPAQDRATAWMGAFF